MKNPKPVHLLYVPTMFCNMGCSYCYLGSQTDTILTKNEKSKIIKTLQKALLKISETNHLAFNVSLHGGEVTTLPKELLQELFDTINNHYVSNFDALNQIGFKKTTPHLKTNLYNFNRLYDLFNKNRVSVSASIDLPLSLHEKYRTTKTGKSTLDKTLKNLKLLANYPHKKKVSAVIYHEHIENIDQLVKDIWFIHNEVGFNMNNFNFMFGFESELNDLKFENKSKLDTKAIPDEMQVEFYNQLKKEFIGTELEEGFRGNWFDEFKPSYCTSALNCGEKFYLLQVDGEVHSCVRGQGVNPFHYGNILNDSFDEIVRRGSHQIKKVHQENDLHEDCQKCEYLYLCHTGCAFVKDQQNKGKSYTCLLQKEIYKDNPKSYPPMKERAVRENYRLKYTKEIHPHKMNDRDDKLIQNARKFIVPSDTSDEKNKLLEIIDNDKFLSVLYDTKSISLKIDDDEISLVSPIINSKRELFYLNQESKVSLRIEEAFFEANCKEIVRNTLHLQLLRDTKVTYGDEKREKQEHILTHQVFHNVLKKEEFDGKNFVIFDLMPLLGINSTLFLPKVLNNLFVTTNDLRTYHYAKQKANAYYHIQAINLPFANFEFFWEN